MGQPQCKLSDQIKARIKQDSKTTIKSTIDWNELLFDLRHLEIRILELVYFPESKPITFATLSNKLNRLNYCERTLRRKIQNLESHGLIKVIHSTIMIINPVISHEQNIRNLTILWNHKDHNL